MIVRSKARTNGGNPEPRLAKGAGSITSSGNGNASTLQEDIGLDLRSQGKETIRTKSVRF
jgi:hypothetical protein